jgi:polar amino acid transport system permease protein
VTEKSLAAHDGAEAKVSTTPASAPPGPPAAHDVETAAPVRHLGRWLAGAVILVLLAQLFHGVVFNDRLDWAVVGDYLFDPAILDGLRRTAVLTVLAMLVGAVIGTLLAMMRLSPNPLLSWVAGTYIWVFRSAPLIVQLLFWYFLAAVMPTIGLGIPFGPEFVTFDTTILIGQLTAAVLGLGLCEAAYTAETVRAGILSVPRGQIEAAQALGLPKRRIMARIVLPQAMRIITPPLGNSTISMLKTTSVVLVIALPDLLTAAQFIYSQNLQQIPLLIVATFWYVVLVSILTVVQQRVERRYSKDSRALAAAIGRPRLIGWRREASQVAAPQTDGRLR